MNLISNEYIKSQATLFLLFRSILFVGLMLFFVLPINVLCSNANTNDTAIVTYWANGNKKTEIVYKKQTLLDKKSDTPFTLMKIIKKTYYNSEGKNISKKDYNALLSDDDFNGDWESTKIESDPFLDSLEYKFNKKAEKFKNSPSSSTVILMIGDKSKGIYFPMNIKFNPKIDLYKTNDTLIQECVYSVCIYKKGIDSSKMEFAGALRSDIYKIYYYDNRTKKEELKIDFELLTKEIGNSLKSPLEIIAGSTSELVSTASQGINNISTKAFAFTLANLIFILSER